jgi:hypothetical protein
VLFSKRGAARFPMRIEGRLTDLPKTINHFLENNFSIITL